MRLFVAIDVPDTIKEGIETDVVDRLRPALPGARWSRPEGRHLTLKFLGEVDGSRIDAIGEVISGVASRHHAFVAAFGEIGGFPNLKRPRVLWAGVVRGSEQMIALADGIDVALGDLGFEREVRPFHPHFTLARFPKPSTIGDLPAADIPSDSFHVDEVILFRSQLHPKGARYTALAQFPLR